MIFAIIAKNDYSNLIFQCFKCEYSNNFELNLNQLIMKKSILIVVLLISSFSNAQKQKIKLPVWIFHSKNTDVIGLSLGIYPEESWALEDGMNRTYGIRLQTFPLAPFYFLAPKSPLSTSDEKYIKTLKNPISQSVYGLNISTGTFEPIDAYGITAVGILNYSRKNNGLILAGASNFIERGNGIIIAGGGNGIYKGNGLVLSSVWGNNTKYYNGLQISAQNYITRKGSGLQIGIFNKAKDYRGIQIGLWNVNDKRKLPLINWQFKS